MVISNENIKVRSCMLRKQVRFVTQAATHQVLSIKKRTIGIGWILGGTLFILCASSKSGGFIIAPAGSALPWGGRGRKFKSCHSDQKSRIILIRLFLSKPQVWHIITTQSWISSVPLGCISSRHSRAYPFLRFDEILARKRDILVFVRMIYTFCESD